MPTVKYPKTHTHTHRLIYQQNRPDYQILLKPNNDFNSKELGQ